MWKTVYYVEWMYQVEVLYFKSDAVSPIHFVRSFIKQYTLCNILTALAFSKLRYNIICNNRS
jgi:hypothetical protein